MSAASFAAASPASLIEYAHAEPHGDGWLLSLHLRADAGGVHLGADNVAIRALDPDAVPLHVVSLHHAAGTSRHIDIVLRAEAGRSAAPASRYAVRLVGLAGLHAPATAQFVLDAATTDQPALPTSDAAPEPDALPPPIDINYLAKDYASFRQLMLDHMNLLAPAWRERNPADLGVALVETLAYAGDQLSYQQDAVATEAYLATARRRSSLQRHSRLIGYDVGSGCNARVWVQVQVNDDNVPLPAGTILLTALEGAGTCIDTSVVGALPNLQHNGCAVFETVHRHYLSQPLNTLQFHTGAASDYSLEEGATHAVLAGRYPQLKPGDVLQFEEVAAVAGGVQTDADPRHRHTVRLVQVRDGVENGAALTHVSWHIDDALPFTLTVAARSADGKPLGPLAVARGNIVLADCGLTLLGERLADVDAVEPYRPQLLHGGLTYREPLTADQARSQSARRTLLQSDRRAVAAIALHPAQPDRNDPQWNPAWTVRRDLLDSDRLAYDFSVDTEADGSVSLRFGDGKLGRRPLPGVGLVAHYRIGNGIAGNIGAEALAHIVTTDGRLTGVRNLMPASGGTEPETAQSIRFNAPGAYKVQRRCVTGDDYAARALDCPGVRQAAAELRWTGSWHSAIVYVTAQGARTASPALRQAVLDHLDGWQLAGCDVQVRTARVLALDIVLSVHVAPGHVAGSVQQALQVQLGRGYVPGGGMAFFHPQHFGFGQALYLSQLLAAASAVPGVARVDAIRFQRFGMPPQGELAAGKISAGPYQVIRVDNDPEAPRNGTLRFLMKGGA